MSIFDPQNRAKVTASLSTRPPLVPANEYRCTVTTVELEPDKLTYGPFEVKQIIAQKSGREMYILKIPLKITDANAPDEAKNRMVFFETFLDLDDNDELDLSPGKNTGLGQFREAVGQNEDGKEWGPEMLVGQPILAMVTHRTTDQGNTFAECKKVAEAA